MSVCEKLETTAEERIVVTSAAVPLYVTYGVRAEELVEQANYHWKTVYACAPYVWIGGVGTIAYEACRFSFSGQRIYGDEVRTLIRQHDRKRPWVPANEAALLTFAIQYPNEQLIRPVVGLDSWVELPAGRFYLYLHKKQVMHPTRNIPLDKSALYLQDCAMDWFHGTQFLAIRRR